MTSRSRILGVLLLAGASSLAAQSDARGARVDSLFAQWNAPGSPGLAVAVVQDGRVVLERGYGLANLEHGIRNTPQTVFDVASVSKQFAGFAIATLAADGRIDLDADVRRYVPELADFGPTITVRHLVHHTSGLRDWPGALAIAGWRMDDVVSYDQILRMAFSQRALNYVPGAEYTYNNTGYNLLAEIVARVSGQSFPAWTEEHIFRPLGMGTSRFHDDHMEVVPRRASPYTRAGAGWAAATDNLTALGSSSLFSSVSDMARWLANFDDARVGGARVLQLMRTRGRLNDGTAIPYAFGIAHGTHRGQPDLSHSGSWQGYVSYLVHFPDRRLGVVVLANTSAVNAQRAAFDVADVYLGPAMATETVAASAPLARQPEVGVRREVLDRHAGIYKLGPGWYVRIRRDGDRLLTRATREDEFPLSARADSVFWVDAYDAAMTFTRDSLVYRGRRVPRVGTDFPRGGDLESLAGDYWSDELQTLYVVEVTGDSVRLRHQRHGIIPLTRAYADDFASATWFMPSVEFQRDGRGRVTGFLVNAGVRVRNVQFSRR